MRVPMKTLNSASVLIALLAVAACSDHAAAPTEASIRLPAVTASASASPLTGFGFNGSASGFPTGTSAVALNGGGSFDPATASNTVPTITRGVAGGGFSCTSSVTTGPLTGCATDEGVRWDTVQLLASTSFRCFPGDIARPATISDHRVILLADFYRAGDANDESFTAQMIVSDTDLAEDIQGEQNLWVQGVGCGTAVVHFSR